MLIATTTLAWNLNAMAVESAGCEQRDVLSKAVSPDGAWVATIYHNVCSDGAFVTTSSDTVEVTRPNETPTAIPSGSGVVFAMDDFAHGEQEALSVEWIAPRSLKITIPNDAFAGRQETSYAGSNIAYRYVPDDPVERACLKQWRSLPTDEMVRRNLSPTENIRAFLAECHAAGRPH